MSVPRILIVGGSTRAAADSVRRAGWLPICADLFADFDLRSTAQVIPVSLYPSSLPVDLAHVHADGWFYCGALENHPEILAQISACNSSLGPLLGTSPDALKFVRDPIWLANTLRSTGLPVLEVVGQSSPPSPDGTWLQKPLAGAGGRLIRVWDESARQRPFSEPHYFQRRAAGIGLSALFRVQNSGFEWLGASRELTIGTQLQPSTDFAYCGSVGPLGLSRELEIDSKVSRRRTISSLVSTQPEQSPLRDRNADSGVQAGDTDESSVMRQLTVIAQSLVSRLPGLKGLVGLDFRLDDCNVWLTEVNPRYTASVEVLELATGRSYLDPYATPTVTPPSSSAQSRPKLIAKQILYATQSMIAPDLSHFLPTANPWQIPIIADIPMPGILIEAGWPICTIMASAETLTEVESILHDHLELIRRALKR